MSVRIDQIRAQVSQTFSKLDEREFALIPTSRSMWAIIDRRFLTEVERYRWFAVVAYADHVYAVADVEGKRVSLQRLVLHLNDTAKSIAEIKQVSFENKNSFDCRLSNLSYRVGRQAVMRNRRKKRGSASKFKGVRKAPQPDTWMVEIKGDNGRVYLGAYKDERYAAAVYDAAAFQLFKGAAHFNLPDDGGNPDAIREAAVRIERHNARVRAKEADRK